MSMRIGFQILSLLFLSVGILSATATPPPTVREAIAGDALLTEGAYNLLATLSDRYGPRMVGTEGHEQSLEFLESELQALGIQTRRQTFEWPGWIRGEAKVDLIQPNPRELRAIALGFVGPAENVVGSLAYVETADLESMDLEKITGKILLLRQNQSLSIDQIKTLAQEHDVKGALYTNRVNGGQLLARAANHKGIEPHFPLFSITQEEGLWLKRKLEDGQDVIVRLNNTSQNVPMVATNLVATIPGKTEQRIILGGHFDSWDLGQGAMDNGLGVAQIFETGRLLKTHSPFNEHTIELVWFDAEELGLWGSRHFAKAEDLSNVRAMVNLDMVGDPIQINAMGFSGLVPFLENYSEGIGGWSFEKKVSNKPWLGSDHLPFIEKGVPSITFNAPINAEDVRYYHDHADTFDKVSHEQLARSSALISLLIFDLANDPSPRVPQLSEEETKQLFIDAGLKERMQQRGGWPFEEDEPSKED